MRLRRIFLLLAVGALAGNLAVACDSSGDVATGGTCFLLTDCAEGLFCHRADGSDNGTCEGKGQLGTIQPAGDAMLADAGAGPMPEPDAAAPGDAAPPPAEDSATGEDAPAAQVDAQTADRTAPKDTGAPPPADSGSGKPDTSTPDTSVPDTSVPDTSAPADTGTADTSSLGD